MTDLAGCLVRSWTHAHEEDANGLMVFRPSDHAFPRARGRRGLTFHADGRVEEVGIGPTDRRVTTIGGWRLLRENAATSCASGTCLIASAWKPAILPVPIRAKRTGLDMRVYSQARRG